MHGWRCGYIAYPAMNQSIHLALQKIQDTVPICCSMAAQYLAMKCLTLEDAKLYLKEKIQLVSQSREILWNEISKAYDCKLLVKGAGSIFFLIPLPVLQDLTLGKWSNEEELLIIEWLARKHKVVVVGGQCFGATGYIRVSFGNRMPEQMKQVAKRLGQGLKELRENNTIKSVHQFIVQDRVEHIL